MWTAEFIEYLQNERNYSPRTVEAYERDLEVFESYAKALDEQISWENLDKDVVRQFIVDRMEMGQSPASVCRNISSLKSFYKYLMRRGLVQRDPVYAIQGPKKAKPLPQFVRESEMDCLFDGNYFPETLQGELERMVLLTFYSTGIRLSEFVGLSWKDVDLVQSQLKVTGKRNKQRIVPFGKELYNAFSQFRQMLQDSGFAVAGDAPVFVDFKSQGRIPPGRVQQIVRFYLSQVTTLKKRSPHVLRHSFATSMLNHHADLQSVKELLGHESISTTEIYTHTTFEELKDMYNQAHPRA